MYLENNYKKNFSINFKLISLKYLRTVRNWNTSLISNGLMQNTFKEDFKEEFAPISRLSTRPMVHPTKMYFKGHLKKFLTWSNRLIGATVQPYSQKVSHSNVFLTNLTVTKKIGFCKFTIFVFLFSVLIG